MGDALVRAVDGISVDIRAGEFVALLGASGSGKSSLLNLVAGLDSPTSGAVTVHGNDLAALSREQLAKYRLHTVGMVFQSFNLFPHLTVLRNISLAQERVMGRSRKQADEVSRQLLSRVGLSDKADQYPNRCSGGQQQRIAIARALALGPQLMLFDEPTSALDPELGLEVHAVIRELAKNGMTMIVVTHEMHFAESVSERVIVMADGRIVEEGTSAQVMRNPTSERAKRFLRAVADR